uniref:Uncharacterized protein n=1 Tax=Lepeophtheirus salmonis TaxID=72036 RepID=A0A0K2VL94_LEPSM
MAKFEASVSTINSFEKSGVFNNGFTCNLSLIH